MEELPKCPRISATIEYPDQVITILRPALRHRGVVAKNKVADRWDVLMLPADEDDAVARKRIPYQCLLFALGKNGQRHEPQPLSHRRHRFKRTPTMAANGHRLAFDDHLFLSRASNKNKIGPIQMSLDGVGHPARQRQRQGHQHAASRAPSRISESVVPSSRTPRCLGCDVGFWAWRMTITCLADIQSSSYTRSGKCSGPGSSYFTIWQQGTKPPARS